MNNNTFVAIMAGGIGSRFWPGSRAARPKQFLDILGVGKSLLRLTFERFLELCPKENIYIVTNAMYKDLVLQQLPEIAEGQVLCEPSRNNTAPCVAYTAFKLHNLNPNARFVVAPSDHIVLDEPEFLRNINTALEYATSNDALLTLGIRPSRPDTGYGYIKYQQESISSIHKVVQFMEKPNLEKAEQFVASGEYLWNAGIFIWSTNSILNALHEHAPEIYRIFDDGKANFNTPNEQAWIDTVYPTTPNISIDYAIMEKSSKVYTLPADFGWSDLGTWNSLHAESSKDDNDNVLHGEQIVTYETSNSIIRVPKHKLVVIKGLSDFIVIDEDDILLICPKSEEQSIKKITEDLKNAGRDQFL